MKTFMVADKEGNKTIPAEQMTTFAYYVQGVQFRFVVTRIQPNLTRSITHRASGKSIAEIDPNSINAALGDLVIAAKGELDKLIAKHGEARIRSVLAAAEINQ